MKTLTEEEIKAMTFKEIMEALNRINDDLISLARGIYKRDATNDE